METELPRTGGPFAGERIEPIIDFYQNQSIACTKNWPRSSVKNSQEVEGQVQEQQEQVTRDHKKIQNLWKLKEKELD